MGKRPFSRVRRGRDRLMAYGTCRSALPPRRPSIWATRRTYSPLLLVVSAQAYQSTHAIETDRSRSASSMWWCSSREPACGSLILALAGALRHRPHGGARASAGSGAPRSSSACSVRLARLRHQQPDALGYLGPVLGAGAALTVAFVAAVVTQVGRPAAGVSRSVAALAIVSVLLGLAQLRYGATHASLAHFHATDDFDELRHRSVPTRSVLYGPFRERVRHWGADASDRVRPICRADPGFLTTGWPTRGAS